MKSEGKDQADGPIPGGFLTQNSPVDPPLPSAHRHFLRRLERASVPALELSRLALPGRAAGQSLARCRASPSPGHCWGTHFPSGKLKPAFSW